MRSNPLIETDGAPRLREALDRFYRRGSFGVKLGLDAERALLKLLGRPESAYGSVHVAGTNGKGSVAAMLEGFLRAADRRTGLYTSPHLVRFNERIRVDGQPIPDDDLLALLDEIETVAAKVAEASGEPPTFFECATAMGFAYFRQRGVDVGLIETGMGGRLDATNVVTPLVSIITSIGLEHTQYLGVSLEDIATEKAGIVKPGVPVVCGSLCPEAMNVVQRIARERGAPCLQAAEAVSVRSIKREWSGQRVSVETQAARYGTLDLPLLGDYQIENLAVAVAAMEVLSDLLGIELDAALLRRGLSLTVWRGRCQVLEPDPLTIVDGAHNPQAARALVTTLKPLIGKRPLGLVLGMCGDKDIGASLKPFAGMVQRCWAVPLNSDRSMPADDVAAVARSMGWEVRTSSVRDALAESKRWAAANSGVVCITGSIFLVGEVLALHEKGETA